MPRTRRHLPFRAFLPPRPPSSSLGSPTPSGARQAPATAPPRRQLLIPPRTRTVVQCAFRTLRSPLSPSTGAVHRPITRALVHRFTLCSAFSIANEDTKARWATFSPQTQRAQIAKNRCARPKAPHPPPPPLSSMQCSEQPTSGAVVQMRRITAPSNAHAFAGWSANLNWLARLMETSFEATRLAMRAGGGPADLLISVPGWCGGGSSAGAAAPVTPVVALRGRQAPMVRAAPTA